ncbi:MAG TPA: 3'-5' exonuclease, partial [Burkholderiales bacterium]|nr:3'-5' exonuclease [Burkholderiales bacterium]
QSIYRFRGAEARLFDQAAGYLQEAFGAVKVPQHESRRCAPAVIEVVNRLFSSEPEFGGYQHHTAHYTSKPGRVEVLPLVPKSDQKKQIESESIVLRNPLERPFEIDEDVRREIEARQLVDRIRKIVGSWQIADVKAECGSRAARYKDIMILVKRRTHLGIYEHALRAAHIPYVTSRQGGLLATLEAQDMTALLQFLVTPFAELKLAHVLRSPVFGCSDDDLIVIAQVPGNTWWDRLARAASTTAQPALSRAYDLMSRWVEQSDSLPVHDQLDRIYFEGDVMRRYAQAVPEAMCGSVRANLHAFMQRALDTDAGRYPSLPRFLHELIDLAQAAPQEAPDEGIVGDAGDAVRILTVHGAKGLESPVVWLLEAGAGREPGDAYEVMVDWPPQAEMPAHFSVCTRKAEHGSKQRELAQSEDMLARREDLNLLYVAMTRAQQALIVSGCDGQGREGSWYEKVRHAVRAAARAELTQDDLAVAVSYGADLAAQVTPSGSAKAERAVDSGAVDPRLRSRMPTGVRRAALPSRGQRYGTRFHGLIDRLTSNPSSSREALQKDSSLSEREFGSMWDSAQRLINEPGLARFFDAKQYVRAANEVAYVSAAGEMRRIDRLVEFEDEVWVLDYKTGILPENAAVLAEYEAQLLEYTAAISAIAAGRRVRAMLLFSNGAHRIVPVTEAL